MHLSAYHLFQVMKPFVPRRETICFAAWNSLFPGMKQFVSHRETIYFMLGNKLPLIDFWIWIKNGRLSKLIGTVVGLLNIRMVGEASKTGTLELLQKARGQKKAIKAAFDELIKAGYAGGHITIAHRNNEKFIEQFSALVREKFAHAMIEVLPTSGLCSFYAEEGGLLMGYEI